jgi:hypothetical protein
MTTTRKHWVKPHADPEEPILHVSADCAHFSDTNPRLATQDEIDSGRPCQTCDSWQSPNVRSRQAQPRSGIEEFRSRRQHPKSSASK